MAQGEPSCTQFWTTWLVRKKWTFSCRKNTVKRMTHDLRESNGPLWTFPDNMPFSYRKWTKDRKWCREPWFHEHASFFCFLACLSSHLSISLTAIPPESSFAGTFPLHIVITPVNTPIILSALASPSHPAMEMTQWVWHFNLLVTDVGYHGSSRAPALSCWLFTR